MTDKTISITFVSDEDCDGLIEIGCAIRDEDIVLDETALNDACWIFVNAWNGRTTQNMSAETWNNLKPMVREAVQRYLRDTRSKR